MSDAVTTVRGLLAPVAEPARAPQMAAYLKQIAPFLGVGATARRAATREWIRALDPGPDAVDLMRTARELAAEPEREFAYVALDLVARHERALPEECLADLLAIALDRPWWDTVDSWAQVIGRGGLRHPGWDRQVATWATDERLWVRRIPLVFQVGRRAQMDLELLFAACRANLADRDFFMRKGIGWGLRAAARHHPDEVRAFVEQNRGSMSALSIREATKHL